MRPWSVLWLCTLAACTSRVTPPAGSVTRSADVLSVVRHGGDPVSSLRATFDVRVERDGSTQQARGVLLVRRPDHFRLRLSSLLGVTFLDYTANGGVDRLWLASEEKTLTGAEIEKETSFSPSAMRLIFLRSAADFHSGCRQAQGRESVFVECKDADGVVHYRGYVRRDSNLLEREAIVQENQEQLVVIYGKYRSAGKARLPYSIEWVDARTGARVRILVRKYEVDPDLPDEFFAPVNMDVG